MKTSVFKMIVTIAAVSMLANAALAKGKSGGNGNGNGGNRSMFKLNSSGSNSSRSLSSSSSSNSFKVFKFDNKKNSIANSNSNSNSSNNNSSANKVFKLNGNGSNSIRSNILSINSNKNNNNVSKLFNNKKGDCHDGKCFLKHCHDGYCYPSHYHYCHSYPSYPCYGHLTTIPVVAYAYEPVHCNYVVVPGDSFYSIAFLEYGTSLTAKHIAMFNGLTLGSGLTPGLILNLPSVSPSGGLTPSGAPVADALRMPPAYGNAMLPPGPMMVGGPTGPVAGPMAPMAGPVGPTGSSVAPANTTAPRPKMVAGSMLQADGQTFGDKPGAARLLVNGGALQIEVLEWLNGAVKIRLPQLQLAGPTNAEIEILRADGSIAAKTPVELVPATGVALAQ